MITGMTGDLNGVEFVSRDVEWFMKKRGGSNGWVDGAVTRYDGR
jgi:hypothetical protein